MELTRKHVGGLMAALVLLMAISRADHFGSTSHLPDASWAVFLLAGFYLPRWALPALLLVAGLVDYWAISFGGVSGWCFTPAYWFLIPTYAVLWWGGRFYAQRYKFTLPSLMESTVVATVATSLAFVISNASFYWMSGYFNRMGMTEYAVQVMQYWLPYLQGVLLYWGCAALLHIAAVTGANISALRIPE